MGAEPLPLPAPPHFDALFCELAQGENAQEHSHHGELDRETLNEVGYFESFPGVAVESASGGFLPPAACYEIYPSLRGEQIAAPLVMTTMALCARNEGASAGRELRLPLFRMREIVMFATPARVRAFRSRMARKALAIARHHGIHGHLAPASDPFFGAGEGRRLFQKLREVKLELRACGTSGEEMAIASFNLHEAFFTARYGIASLDGGVLQSSCAAFGLERWEDAWQASRASKGRR